MSLPITPHFPLDKFACHDGTPYPPEWIDSRLKPLCDMLEVIRFEAGGESIIIDDGFRTLEYDERLHAKHIAALKAQGLPDDHLVAEASSSQHPKGTAADIRHASMSALALFNLILKLFECGKLSQLGGVGLYPNFVHVDIRPRPGANGPTTGHLAIWGARRPSNAL